MIRFLKSLLPFKLKRKLKNNLGVPSLHWSLNNLKQIGFCPKNVVDVGAYEGNWTLDFLEVFPNASVLMLEAQQSKENILKNISEKNRNVKYQIGLLSSVENEKLYFYQDETASHVANGNNLGNKNVIEILTSTVDKAILNTKMDYPCFLKLDVQGHEIQVLKGAKKALESAIFCLLEVSFLSLSENEPQALDVIKYMDDQDFQMYDITQFMRRPFDKALYQLDLLFIKKNSEYIKEKRWN